METVCKFVDEVEDLAFAAMSRLRFQSDLARKARLGAAAVLLTAPWSVKRVPWAQRLVSLPAH